MSTLFLYDRLNNFKTFWEQNLNASIPLELGVKPISEFHLGLKVPNKTPLLQFYVDRLTREPVQLERTEGKTLVFAHLIVKPSQNENPEVLLLKYGGLLTEFWRKNQAFGDPEILYSDLVEMEFGGSSIIGHEQSEILATFELATYEQ